MLVTAVMAMHAGAFSDTWGEGRPTGSSCRPSESVDRFDHYTAEWQYFAQQAFYPQSFWYLIRQVVY